MIYYLSLQIDDFETKCVIGQGKFGVVTAVQDPISDKFYAMKILEKEIVVENHLELHLLQVRDWSAEFSSPFIPKLFATFSDAVNLYMLSELVQGGDFWSILVISVSVDF